MLGDVEQRNERLRREVLERVAVRQHETADPARIVGEQQLAEAPPVSLPTSVTSVEAERVEHLVDHPGHPGRRQIGVGVHRRAMAAERPVDEVRSGRHGRRAARRRDPTACCRRGSRGRTPPAGVRSRRVRRPVVRAFRRRWSRTACRLLVSSIQHVGNLHTDCMKVNGPERRDSGRSRTAATRAALVAAARTLFAEHGYARGRHRTDRPRRRCHAEAPCTTSSPTRPTSSPRCWSRSRSTSRTPDRGGRRGRRDEVGSRSIA